MWHVSFMIQTQKNCSWSIFFIKQSKQLTKLRGSLTGERAYLHEHFVMKQLPDGKIFITFLIQNLEMIISLPIVTGIQALEWGPPKIRTKLVKLHSGKRQFRGQNDDVGGIPPGCSANKSMLFLFMRLKNVARRILYNSWHCLFRHFFVFLDTFSCFTIVSFRNLMYSKIGHARRTGNFTREITPNEEFLIQLLSDCKVLWITLEQLFEIWIKLTISDNSRAICVMLRWPNHLLFPSGRSKARRTWKFSRDFFFNPHRICVTL